MIRIAAIVVFFHLSVNVARAEVDLVQVPVACGTIAEIYGLLQTKMPGMSRIGTGSDKRAQDIAVLFAGAEHWALVATMTADQICIVASGRIWTVASAAPVAQF